jgi:hypothetical protein
MNFNRRPAEQIRRIAAKTAIPALRAQLLETARQFESLARYSDHHAAANSNSPGTDSIGGSFR